MRWSLFFLRQCKRHSLLRRSLIQITLIYLLYHSSHILPNPSLWRLISNLLVLINFAARDVVYEHSPQCQHVILTNQEIEPQAKHDNHAQQKTFSRSLVLRGTRRALVQHRSGKKAFAYLTPFHMLPSPSPEPSRSLNCLTSREPAIPPKNSVRKIN